MSVTLTDISSFTIFAGGFIALYRFSNIEPRYYPFIFLLWIGCINEILSFVLVHRGMYTIVNSNIYILLESILITWFFKRMRIFDGKSWLFQMFIICILVSWTVENLLVYHLSHYSIYFRIFYSSMIVLMSIVLINYLLLTEYQPVGKNAGFILCVGFITYFLFMVLVNSFWLYGLISSKSFLLYVSKILVFVNLFTNLIYAMAILWIPKKQPYLLPL
jgi:hypothetical protein